MRNQEQIEFLYKTYIKKCGKLREDYEAGYDPYFYGMAFGAAYALGRTLEKSIREITRDIERAERKRGDKRSGIAGIL